MISIIINDIFVDFLMRPANQHLCEHMAAVLEGNRSHSALESRPNQ